MAAMKMCRRPWHKEILWAIQEGVTVLGGASLGALRAFECAPFGMIGVGEVFRRYASGELVDDSDVAQSHGPAELGCIPVTDAFVNVEATLRNAEREGSIDAASAEALIVEARAIFFKELTLDALARHFEADPAKAELLCATLASHYVDIKRQDALELLTRLAALPDERIVSRRDWALTSPTVWRQFLESLRAGP